MLVYEGIKSGFINDVDLGIIADKIRNKYIEKIKRKPSAPEFNSWKNSMQYMRGVLSDNEILLVLLLNIIFHQLVVE